MCASTSYRPGVKLLPAGAGSARTVLVGAGFRLGVAGPGVADAAGADLVVVSGAGAVRNATRTAAMPTAPTIAVAANRRNGRTQSSAGARLVRQWNRCTCTPSRLTQVSVRVQPMRE
jgi:hypothetical protein